MNLCKSVVCAVILITGYTRCDSMIGVFLELLSLPTLDTIVHNSRVLFANQCQRSHSKILQWFLTIRVY